MIRRMIKWQPFYAIPGQEKIIKELLNEKEKINLPIILNNEEIDYNLRYALKYNKEVSVKFYDYGFVKKTYGKITKIDKVNKYLIINNKRIYFKYILMID